MREQPSKASGQTEIAGNWWLPDSESDGVYGVVRYEPEKLLKAQFSGEVVPSLFKEQRSAAVNVVWGRSDQGIPCSLVRCWPTGQRAPVGQDVTSQEFLSELLVVGAHIRDASGIAIRKVEANYLHLVTWVAAKAFADEWCFIPWPTKTATEILIGSQESTTRAFGIPFLDSQISFKVAVTSSGDPYRELTLEQTATLVFDTSARDWFNWYLPKLSYLEGLFTLLIQEPVRITGVRATLIVEGRELPARLFFAGRSGQYAESIDHRGLAIPLPEIEDTFSQVLQAWFEKEEILRIPVELYLQSVHNQGGSLVPTFLQLMTGIEVFHRRAKGGKYLDESEFEEFRKTLLSHVPRSLSADFRQSFENRIEYSNEHSLGKRMKSIREEIPHTPGIVISDSFWRRSVNTRNFYTHYSQELDESIYGENELPLIVFVLQRLLAELLLVEVGIPREVLRKGLSRNYGIHGVR